MLETTGTGGIRSGCVHLRVGMRTEADRTIAEHHQGEVIGTDFAR